MEPQDHDDPARPDDPAVTEWAEAVEEEIEERNPDDVTRREAYERELAEEGIPEAGRHVGDETP